METAAIRIWNRQRRVKIDSEAVGLFCGALAESLCLSGRAFSVIFVGIMTMRGLNRKWRNKDSATDVLSFGYGDEIIDGIPFLGEIVIAPEIALRQAAEYGVPVEHEVRKLIAHGALHLMGYDHETDGGEMIRMQHRVSRRRFFTARPVIVRHEVKL